MKTFLLFLQIIISVILVILVSVQSKSGGLGSAFGAGQGLYSQRRGVEKVILYVTIIFIFLFLLLSVLNLLSQ